MASSSLISCETSWLRSVRLTDDGVHAFPGRLAHSCRFYVAGFVLGGLSHVRRWSLMQLLQQIGTVVSMMIGLEALLRLFYRTA